MTCLSLAFPNKLIAKHFLEIVFIVLEIVAPFDLDLFHTSVFNPFLQEVESRPPLEEIAVEIM